MSLLTDREARTIVITQMPVERIEEGVADGIKAGLSEKDARKVILNAVVEAALTFITKARARAPAEFIFRN